MLYIRQLSKTEGLDFWKKYAIVGSHPLIHKTFWDLYPEVEDPMEKIKEGVKIKIRNEMFIVKIVPKIHTYISNKENVPNLKEVVSSFVDYDVSSTIFFTLKGYSEIIEEKVNAFNLNKYNKFTFQPQENEIQYYRLFPSIRFADKLKRYANASILADRSDALEVLHPPVRISSFDSMPRFKRKKIIKNWTGLTSLEPTQEFNRKIARPIFLNPTYITVEFSPYFDDENKRLLELLAFFKLYQKDWNLHRNDIIDVVNYINYLKDQSDRKRSKLDYLMDYIRVYKPNIYHLRLSRLIYKYTIMSKELKPDNGLLIVRRNGEISDFIYFIKFESIEFWAIKGNVGYFDINKMFDGKRKNLYFYSHDENEHKSAKDRFLLVTTTFTDVNLKSLPTLPDPNIQKQQLEILNISKRSNFKIIKKFFIIRKRFYDSEHVILNIKFQDKHLIGTVRCKGEKIIYIVRKV